MVINVTSFQMRDIILLQRKFFSDGKDRRREYDEAVKALGIPIPLRVEVTYEVKR